MNASESVSYDEGVIIGLRKLISRGEGSGLEFKRKIAHPEKVAREVIAFANTAGGVLLIGVDDDGTLAGVKYPEEEILSLQQNLEQHCRPQIDIATTIIALSPKKFIVRIDIPAGSRRPYYYRIDQDTWESFVRAKDKSVKASKEILEIVRRQRKEKNTRFTFGDHEKALMEYLEQKGVITLDEFRALTRLNRFVASKKLVLLVLANVLRITPGEKGDTYSRA